MQHGSHRAGWSILAPHRADRAGALRIISCGVGGSCAAASAEQLHLTQPAVSNALKRLRDQFDDVLFVRTATGMEPTPRAEVIARLLEEGVAALHMFGPKAVRQQARPASR